MIYEWYSYNDYMIGYQAWKLCYWVVSCNGKGYFQTLRFFLLQSCGGKSLYAAVSLLANISDISFREIVRWQMLYWMKHLSKHFLLVIYRINVIIYDLLYIFACLSEGSSFVGRKVAESAARNLRPCVLELVTLICITDRYNAYLIFNLW